jgi:hypothetical protein
MTVLDILKLVHLEVLIKDVLLKDIVNHIRQKRIARMLNQKIKLELVLGMKLYNLELILLDVELRIVKMLQHQFQMIQVVRHLYLDVKQMVLAV